MSQTQAQKEKKAQIIGKHKTSAADTGSPEVQVALFTARINDLTNHLRTNKNDVSTQRGLLKLVGQRRRALNYLQTTAPKRYAALISTLDLRK